MRHLLGAGVAALAGYIWATARYEQRLDHLIAVARAAITAAEPIDGDPAMLALEDAVHSIAADR